MEKPIKPGRVTALACILMLLVIVFVVALYKLQIVDGKAYYEENRNSVASSQTVEAARGSILDRYGHVLVSNTSCNNLVFNPDDLFEQDNPNGILLQMARTVAACGDTYVDELPVTAKPPFEYTDMNDTQRTQLKGFLKYAGLDEEATAVELMSYCREKFEINNNYSAADMRIIAGLRYSIKTRYIDKLYLPDYVFVQDASMELITSLKENNVPGFEVTVSYTRQYHTNLAAHLLGYTGKMNAEEYTTYKTQGYPMSATVGKDGAELAFEKYLHGTNGTAIVTKNASGTVTGTTYTKEPEPGDQVSLTIDLDLQAAAEQSLTRGIENMKSKSTETSDAVGGGALVAVDVATGQPLAIANYPTFDLQTLFQSQESYDAVKDAENEPLFNRALLGQYSPGSTFKPCTAIAGLTEGVITTGTRIQCTGTFRKYEDTGYAPKCWIASSGATHGNDNVTEAIRDSCNIFFYTVGDSLPIDTLARYAAAFGLGEHTGIELPESTGQMATEAVKKKLENTNWYVGDSLQAAIGQSYSLFTPLQLAEYCATIANGTQAGLQSIICACDELRSGAVDAVLAAGTDENSEDITEVYSHLPLPGHVVGEGCVTMLLEDAAAAQARGARIYAEILGYAGTHQAARYGSEPAQEQVDRTLAGALQDAGLTAVDRLFTAQEMKARTGDARAASAALALAEACRAVSSGECRTAAALATGWTGSVSCVIVGRKEA